MPDSSILEDVVRKARARSEVAHGNQKRHNGNAYATHPHAVACILDERGLGDATTLAVAYLHDVLEDTTTTEAALTTEFGEVVVGLVKELTNLGPPDRSFSEKQTALLEHARKMSPRAKLVKLADRLHNLQEMTVWPNWRQERYARAALELLEALRPWPDETLALEVHATAVSYLCASE